MNNEPTPYDEDLRNARCQLASIDALPERLREPRWREFLDYIALLERQIYGWRAARAAGFAFEFPLEWNACCDRDDFQLWEAYGDQWVYSVLRKREGTEWSDWSLTRTNQDEGDRHVETFTITSLEDGLKIAQADFGRWIASFFVITPAPPQAPSPNRD